MQSFNAEIQKMLIIKISQLAKSIKNGGIKQVGKVMVSQLLNLYYLDYSQRVVRVLGPLRKLLRFNIAKCKQSPQGAIKEQLLFSLHFSRALIFQFLKDKNAKQQYKCAFHFSQHNHLLCLCFSFFLIGKQEPQQAIKYLQKINLETVIQLEHRDIFKNIFMAKLRIIDQNFIFQTKQGNKQILIKQYYMKVLKMTAEFFQLAIKNDKSNYLYYINLTNILMRLNRRQEVLEWMEILKELSLEEQSINMPIGELHSDLKMFRQSVNYFKNSIKTNQKNELAYQFLIASLVQCKQYGQAKQYIVRLIKINKRNPIAYKKMGIIFSQEGKYDEAIKWYKRSLSINSNDKETYSLAGYSLKYMWRVREAIQCYTHSIRIQPLPWTYNQLGNLYQLFGQIISAFKFYKQSILLNHAQLIPYLNFSKYAQQNIFFRNRINIFLEQLNSKHTKNKHVQFHIALYYYLSKQSCRQLHQLIIQFNQMKKDGRKVDQIYSNIISKTLRQYSSFTLQFKQESTIFSLIIIIFSRLIGNKTLSHSCFIILFNKYKTKGYQSPSQIFTTVYNKLLLKQANQLLPLFMEFIIIQILQQSPHQALKSYFKALNYCNDEYNNFKIQLRNKIGEELQKILEIDSIFSILTVDSKQQNGQHNYSHHQGIINVDELKSIIVKAEQIKRRFRECCQSRNNLNLIEQWFLIYDGNSTNHSNSNILRDALVGLHWRKQLPEQYYIIFTQINKQQQNTLQQILILVKRYQFIGDKMMGIKLALRQLQNYFQKDFIVNQTIKLIYNSLYPFILSESIHRQFAFILHKFKNINLLDYYNLKKELKQLFQQRIQKQQEQADQQSSIASSFFFEENGNPEGIIISTKKQTQSQADPFEEPLQFFIDDDQRNKRQRKYSDSNVANITTEENEQFIRSTTEKKQQKNVLKIVLAPFEGKEDNLSDCYSSQQQQNQDDQPQSQIVICETQREKDSLENSISQSNKLKKHQLIYTIDNTNFLNKRLYSGFNKILFKNTFAIIKYLSINYKQHIAKHYLVKHWNQSITQFTAQAEKGDKFQYPYITDGQQNKALRWIWLTGVDYVFHWIIHTALGIAELQQLGIYHADLAFRNTIRVSRNGWYAFKIIDFDKAFKVIKAEQKDEAYECTKDLIDHWLRFRFDLQKPRAPYDQLNMSHFQSSQGKSSQSSKENEYKQADIIKHIFLDADQSLIDQLINIKYHARFSPQRLSKCLQKLKEYMHVSHQKQFKDLVYQLLLGTELQHPCIYSQSDQSMIFQILEYLQKGDIDFYAFSKRVTEITKGRTDDIKHRDN